MLKRETIKVRKYKAGYEIRDELVDDSEYGGTGYAMKTAYTSSGAYIGDTKRAYWLCKKRGIKPEKISQEHNVCSIGFCEKEQKWYGWSHRAMFGFGIGSKVVKGDCGFTPGNAMELYASLSEEDKKNVVAMDGDKITIRYFSRDVAPVNPSEPQGQLEVVGEPIEQQYVIEVGRGEWEAKILEDAKQMAIDFARSIS